jgi:hypothetical protein
MGLEGRLINVRKLVALDIYLLWFEFILAEFGAGTPVIIAVGLWLILANIFALGIYLLRRGISYIPLLVYAIIIARLGTAEKEVKYGLEHDKHYNRKYSVQQLMIFIPLTIVILTILQEIKITNTPS